MKNDTEYLTFMSSLLQHYTRVLYDERRVSMLQLISRKIAYKERLLKEFDTEFSEGLHKRLISAENEVSALISFVQAFDNMAEHLTSEAANAADNAYELNRKNLTLNFLLNSQNELTATWSDTAFKLASDFEKTLYKQPSCLNQK